MSIFADCLRLLSLILILTVTVMHAETWIIIHCTWKTSDKTEKTCPMYDNVHCMVQIQTDILMAEYMIERLRQFEFVFVLSGNLPYCLLCSALITSENSVRSTHVYMK